jgi:hypothetical protein
LAEICKSVASATIPSFSTAAPRRSAPSARIGSRRCRTTPFSV